VSECGYMIGTDIILGIDCTASNFWNPITSEYKVEKYRPVHMEEYHIMCEGEILEIVNSSKITRICECQCHSSMYQLTRRMQAAKSQY
jgi:enolase